MQHIGLVLKRGEQQAISLGEKITAFLQRAGKKVLLESACRETALARHTEVVESIADESDLLIVLGGDGTILRAASLLNDKSIPVLGVNLGRVGFMAEVAPEEAIPLLQSTLEGKAEFVSRMLLELTLPDGRKKKVLNDAVIHWGGIARLIDLGVKIGASREMEIRADGLIVSTPIGSSAYSYAANGPLVHPDVQGILLTPICPYSGLKRPVLIPPDFCVDLRLKRGEDLTLTLDGHTRVGLRQGDSLLVSRAAIPFTMVKSQDRDYFDVLNLKLRLI
jgi:NAD+ kinase